MMTHLNILDRIGYARGFEFEVEHIPDEGVTLYVICHTEDSRHPGRPIEIHHPTVIPDEYLNDDRAMVSFIRQCLIRLAIHEIDEWFRFDGELVNDPHGVGYYEDLKPIPDEVTARLEPIDAE